MQKNSSDERVRVPATCLGRALGFVERVIDGGVAAALDSAENLEERECGNTSST
jgi:hypothetical protein